MIPLVADEIETVIENRIDLPSDRSKVSYDSCDLNMNAYEV